MITILLYQISGLEDSDRHQSKNMSSVFFSCLLSHITLTACLVLRQYEARQQIFLRTLAQSPRKEHSNTYCWLPEWSVGLDHARWLTKELATLEETNDRAEPGTPSNRLLGCETPRIIEGRS